jgi:type IV pilus assembly protein PilB
MNVLPLLVDSGLIKASDAPQIERAAKEAKTSVETELGKRGIQAEDILKVKSQKYGIPYRVLGEAKIPENVMQYIPEESARHYHFIPIGFDQGALEVGVTDPDNIEAADALQFISSKIDVPYKLYLVGDAEFDRVLADYQNLTGEVGEALSEYDTDSTSTVSLDEAPLEEKTPDAATIKADAPVTKIVATILRYAVEGGASDIHIEPSINERTRVRFRMDGELHTSLELPAKVHPAVVARIKILSQMRLDEKRKPQDGRFSATVEGRRIDFRVSTFPTQAGEKVVMRILDRSKSAATLETVGLNADDLATIRDIIRAPYGIILMSGPTGSGKSTTLFAMLSELDRETQNVVSVEDPVEYEIDHVAQSQVHPEIGYTFASGLRSILRQDPDVIMVGEIRDKETAQLAIQAALTGHLVFSTIHTNTAAGAIPRLIDMGVDPYLIAPTLIAVIGQRLVRKLCDGAADPMPVSESIKLLLEKDFEDLPQQYRTKLPEFKQLYRAKPTSECPNGTRGRMGVFEILRMDKELEQVVLNTPVEERVYAAARAKGMYTMREDAIVKALKGEIPFTEVNNLGGALLADDEETS